MPERAVSQALGLRSADGDARWYRGRGASGTHARGCNTIVRASEMLTEFVVEGIIQYDT